jgi:hypothetical protein
MIDCTRDDRSDNTRGLKGIYGGSISGDSTSMGEGAAGVFVVM